MSLRQIEEAYKELQARMPKKNGGFVPETSIFFLHAAGQFGRVLALAGDLYSDLKHDGEEFAQWWSDEREEANPYKYEFERGHY